MLKLYGTATSPFVRHCRIALAQSRLSWELEKIDHAQSAEQSPTKRMPYLKGEGLALYDSMSILHHARAAKGETFLSTAAEAELFALATTIIDSIVTVILLEGSGVQFAETPYGQRHFGRIHDSLAVLETQTYPDVATDETMHDGYIRIACLLIWAVYRDKLVLADYPNLERFASVVNQWQVFAQTAPPPK